MTQTSRDKLTHTIAWLLALFFAVNGTFMLVNPNAWYWAVEGVADTGPFNQHFIRDIGLIYLGSGFAMAIGAINPSLRLGLWASAAAWMMGHALFHVWEVAVGICGPEALLRDFVGVTLPAVLATALAISVVTSATASPGSSITESHT